MNPLALFDLALVALEGVARVLNPKLRREKRGNAGWSGFLYVVLLLAGVALVVILAFR